MVITERSYEKISKSDLRKLLKFAHDDRESLFSRYPRLRRLYHDRILCIALCQGAALHYQNGENGVKDFDVWTFYFGHPQSPFPYRRIGHRDFGISKFGCHPLDAKKFKGRCVDLIGRSLKAPIKADPVKVLLNYLMKPNTKTAKELGKKAVVLLYPQSQFGKIIWPPKSNNKVKLSETIKSQRVRSQRSSTFRNRLETKLDRNSIECLIRHCRMYLFGSSGSPENVVNQVANDFYTFALLHLVATMFITTDHIGGPEGVFHRLLDPAGFSSWLQPIDSILGTPLGKTNLKQFLRTKRNKLATHGELAWRSQPSNVQAVTFDDSALEQYQELMEQLDPAILELLRRLETLTKKS